MDEARQLKIGIVGSGVVGRSWAMLFASRGHSVLLYDNDDSQLSGVLDSIRETLTTYESDGYIKGRLSVDEQLRLISVTRDLRECLSGAFYIQECVFERLDVKRAIMSEIDAVMDDTTIVASSSSAIPMSQFTETLRHRGNMIIAHPVNPLYFVPLVELVPTSWTDPSVVTATRDLMSDIGQSPIVVKEIAGFALNRIQYAILNESWNLVRDGYITAEDMDKVMYEGLGRRYAFIGPLETARLNAQDLNDYFDRYANGMRNVSKTFLPPPEYRKEQVAAVEEEMAKLWPREKLDERRKWRNTQVALLSALRKENDMPK